MHAAKEKLSDAASAAKEKVSEVKAKAEEKAETAAARTHREREEAHERAKAKEAEAKMEEHRERAEHRAERDVAEHGGVGRVPLVRGSAGLHHRPLAGETVDPTYPAGTGRPAGEKYM